MSPTAGGDPSVSRPAGGDPSPSPTSGGVGRLLVAGMGNVLRGDDGFGVAVADVLAARDLPPGVTVIEVGIGGMHLVQELMEGYDAVVVVDAVDRGADPGTVFLLEPRVPSLEPLPPEKRSALLTDMHHTVPSRALILAKALGVLPPRAWILGCQPEDPEALGLELSEPVRRAVPVAVARLEGLLGELALPAEGGTGAGTPGADARKEPA